MVMICSRNSPPLTTCSLTATRTIPPPPPGTLELLEKCGLPLSAEQTTARWRAYGGAARTRLTIAKSAPKLRKQRTVLVDRMRGRQQDHSTKLDGLRAEVRVLSDVVGRWWW